MAYGDPYRWTDGTPGPGRPRMLRIVRAPKEGSLELVCLSDHLVFVWQHFLDQRTVGCTAGYGCKCEVESIPTRLYAYLGCALCTTGQVVLLQLTDEGCRGLQLQDSPLCGPSLRGFTVSVRRDPKAKGGKVQSGVVTKPPYGDDKIPKAPDVRAELIKIWNSNRK